MAGLHVGGDEGGGGDAALAGGDANGGVGLDGQSLSVVGVELREELGRCEFLQGRGIAGSGLGVPLGGAATSG